MGCRKRIRLALLLATCVVTGRTWAQLKPGIVVESIAKYSEGEKAGVQEGDVLLSWSRGDTKGEIESPFDLSNIEIEQVPRGNVTIEGFRGVDKRFWALGPDDWGIKARPNLPQNLLSIYLEGQELAKAGTLNEAPERWRSAALEAQHNSFSLLSVWLFFHSAEQLAEARQWKEADADYQQASQEASGAGPSMAAQLLSAWAVSYEQHDDLADAEACYRQSLQDDQKLGRESLFTATILNSLGGVLRLQSKLAEAKEYSQQAIAIQQRIAPGSLAVAHTLSTLGLIDLSGENLGEADDLERQALAIQEKLAPGSLSTATTLLYSGVAAWYRGDLTKADEYLLQALNIQQKLASGSLMIASTFNNLGVVASYQGDLAEADGYFRRALEIREKLAPGSVAVAGSFNNLGHVAWRRSDLARAESYFTQGLALDQKLTPESVGVASDLVDLGGIAAERGDDTVAERYLRQALAIHEKLAPNDMVTADAFDSLGDVFTDRDDIAQAEQYYRQALKIRQNEAPDSPNIAQSLQHLGDVARSRDDLIKAENYYRQALAIRAAQVPSSRDHAESLAALGGIKRRQRQVREAAQLYEQALNALEGQTARLGGSEQVRSSFRAKYARYYEDYIDLLLESKQPELAFQVLEHLRARSLLETLAAARVDIRTGVDPVLLKKESSLQQSFSAKSSRRIELLGDKHTPEQLAALDKEIKNILEQYQDVEELIRATSPAYAALTQPQPLSAREVQQQLLDPDTLLLEYSLGEDRSYVFAATPDSLNAYELPKRAEIESSARRLYQLLGIWRLQSAGIESGKVSRKTMLPRETELNQAAAALSQMVLGPVVSQLQAKRLLIVSDGALQYVPFSVLPVPQSLGTRKSGSKHSSLPLIAGHEVIKLPSASVLAVLRQQVAAHKTPAKAVAVLADPVFDKDDDRVGPRPGPQKPSQSVRSTIGESESGPASDESPLEDERLTRSLADISARSGRGFYLARLPYTRREAQAILAVTPSGQGMQALDFDASRATATDPQLAQYRIVHFATHGLLDSEHPELSGLVLTLVDKRGNKQDGFLGLQDIYNLNLPADLVVLSACETGLGKQINGEGLIGLTRGFMYAGATRVMASLWKVDDVATAELMRRFYRAVEREGMRPAAALQKAQIEMWKQPRWHDHYYWAAFELQGEWK